MTFFYCLLWVEYVYCWSRTSRFPTCRGMYCKLRRAEWSWWNPWTVRSDFTWETYKWSLHLKLNVIDMKQGDGGWGVDLQCQNLIALDCEKKRCFILSPLYTKLSDRWPFPLAFLSPPSSQALSWTSHTVSILIPPDLYSVHPGNSASSSGPKQNKIWIWAWYILKNDHFPCRES